MIDFIFHQLKRLTVQYSIHKWQASLTIQVKIIFNNMTTQSLSSRAKRFQNSTLTLARPPYRTCKESIRYSKPLKFKTLRTHSLGKMKRPFCIETHNWSKDLKRLKNKIKNCRAKWSMFLKSWLKLKLRITKISNRLIKSNRYVNSFSNLDKKELVLDQLVAIKRKKKATKMMMHKCSRKYNKWSKKYQKTTKYSKAGWMS